jgi:hypothetical protein
MPHLVEDVLRIPASKSDKLVDSLKPLMISLAGIQHRHRKVLSPIISSFVSAASNPSSEIAASAIDKVLSDSSLEHDERDVIRAALDLRVKCRAVDEGGETQVKRIIEGLERRE